MDIYETSVTSVSMIKYKVTNTKIHFHLIFIITIFHSVPKAKTYKFAFNHIIFKGSDKLKLLNLMNIVQNILLFCCYVGHLQK